MVISFVVFTIAIFAETNRLPFDLPEAETELVGGYHTEYGSMKFGLFFLGEYVAMITGSAIIVTLFLGGWHFPGIPDGSHGWGWGLLNIFIFFSKIAVLLFVFYLGPLDASAFSLRSAHAPRLGFLFRNFFFFFFFFFFPLFFSFFPPFPLPSPLFFFRIPSFLAFFFFFHHLFPNIPEKNFLFFSRFPPVPVGLWLPPRPLPPFPIFFFSPPPPIFFGFSGFPRRGFKIPENWFSFFFFFFLSFGFLFFWFLSLFLLVPFPRFLFFYKKIWGVGVGVVVLVGKKIPFFFFFFSFFFFVSGRFFSAPHRERA